MTNTTAVNQTVDQTVADIHDAMALLSGLPQPNLDETLEDLHQRLLVTRSAQSRIAELVGYLIRLHRGVRNLLLDAEGDLEDASAAVVQRPSFGHQNFAAADERKAMLAAHTLEQRHAVRQMEKLRNDADAALEYGNNRFWELNRAVHDIEVRMRLILKEPNYG